MTTTSTLGRTLWGAAPPLEEPPLWSALGSYDLTPRLALVVARGSVVDFSPPTLDQEEESVDSPKKDATKDAVDRKKPTTVLGSPPRRSNNNNKEEEEAAAGVATTTGGNSSQDESSPKHGPPLQQSTTTKTVSSPMKKKLRGEEESGPDDEATATHVTKARTPTKKAQKKSTRAAIVNAANEGCLGGAGVDGAITSAGGPNLHRDRLQLPILMEEDEDEADPFFGMGAVRCRVGDAVLTGPGDYGRLRVPYVIHAVAPNFHQYDEQDYLERIPHRLLARAYQAALDRAADAGLDHVAFSLLAAGVFRGSCPLHEVLVIGIRALQSWAQQREKEHKEKQQGATASSTTTDTNDNPTMPSKVYLFAFTKRECQILQHLCEQLLH